TGSTSRNSSWARTFACPTTSPAPASVCSSRGRTWPASCRTCTLSAPTRFPFSHRCCVPASAAFQPPPPPPMSKRTGRTERPRRARADPARAPTMRDIAARVGVHQTTVSLALRHHPSIPEHTRERIVAAAKEIGYRPNPLLNAFNFHRVAGHPVKGAPVLAMVFDARMHPRSTEHEYPRLLFQAARDTARGRGYQLEPFVLQENGLHSN